MSRYIKKGVYFKSYIGLRLGNLTVISESDRYQQTKYRRVTCKCDCGNTTELPLQTLLYPDSNRKSLLACQRCIDRQKIIDNGLKGKRFGKLTVVDVVPRKSGKEILKVTCKCECGNTIELPIQRFQRKAHFPTSCGCESKISKVKVGNRYGMLTVIEDLGKDENSNRICLCKCDCGNTITVKSHDLVRTKWAKTHCGCQTYFKDITGQRFGKLVAVEPKGRDKYKNALWLFKCDCGGTIVLTYTRVQHQKYPNCGCVNTALKVDYTGQRFGKLEVIEYLGNCKYLCKCECGNTIEVHTDRLRTGHIHDCGCENPHHDLIGTRIGKLEVIEYLGKNDSPYHQYLCKCDCGNTVIRRRDYILEAIKDNRKCDCGCVKLNKLVGQKFGKLTVIKYVGRNKHGVNWLCKCDCGNFKEIRESYLLSGHTKSCGCTQSHGEERIGQLFLEHNIYYEKEKTFEGLVSDKGFPLRLDYYLPEYNCVIEYDGIQHFALIKTGWDNEERYNLRVYHDFLKVKYCIDNNITLIKVPYTHRDTVAIEEILPQTSPFIISTLEEYDSYRSNYKDNKKYYKWYKKVIPINCVA